MKITTNKNTDGGHFQHKNIPFWVIDLANHGVDVMLGRVLISMQLYGNSSFQVPTQTFIHSFPALSHEDPAAKNVVVDPPSSPPKAASQSGRRLDDRRFGSADAWRHVPWRCWYVLVVPSPGGNAWLSILRSAGITRKQKGMVMWVWINTYKYHF